MPFFLYMEKQVFDVLEKIEQNGYEAFVIGGFVRDRLLGINSFDIDICTSAKSCELKKIFPNLIYKNFYSSTLKIDEFNFDITTYRIDEKYDGRKPLKIQICSDVKDDLKRRDFTINTILLDKNGHMIDYLNGIGDFNKKQIKEVYPNSMADDYLRILRCIRFASLLSFKIEESTEIDIINNAEKVSKLSSYRIKEELDKILQSKNFSYGLELMKKFNIDKYLNIDFHNMKYTKYLIGMYAQMDINIDNFFGKKELKQINLLKKYLNKKLDNYGLYILGFKNVCIIDDIRCLNLKERYSKLPIKSSKDLNVTYKDIKNIHKYEEIIIRAILDNKIRNEKNDIIKFLNG